MRSLVLEGIIRLSQHTTRGNCKVSFNVLQSSFVETGPAKRTEADHEATGLDEFLTRFDPSILPALAGKQVLDFGCGYGGKAVELASRVPTAVVTGVDQHQKKMDRGTEYAARRGVPSARFVLCTQDHIPLDDASIDAVVCHDVMEHVHRPDVTLSEMARVLRPGGRAYIVFPPYVGPVSHHLDFITTAPFVHWFFSPDTIMDTVNLLLGTEYGRRFNTPPQPRPAYSHAVNRVVLPSLNGMGTAEFARLAGPAFDIVRIDRATLIDRLTKLRMPAAAIRALKSVAIRALPVRALDRLTISMAVVLERRIA